MSSTVEPGDLIITAACAGYLLRFAVVSFQKKAKTEEKAEPGDGAAKEAAQEPSDDQLAAEVKEIVAGVNIQEFSLKDLMARLGAPRVALKRSFGSPGWSS